MLKTVGIPHLTCLSHLYTHSLQRGHPAHLQRLAPEQVRGPDDGHVLGRHPGVAAAQGDAVQVTGEELEGPGTIYEG